MIAIIEIKGKQYRVSENQVIRSLQVQGEPGDKIPAVRVLATIDGDNVNLGTPAIDGATVTLEIVRHAKSPKIKIYKSHPGTTMVRHAGYRDKISYLRISEIKV
jgi:large subunit ribosomal protein L21